LKQLLPPESLRDRRGAADMEPALVCAAETVELHCWAAVTKRWRLVGTIAIGGSAFEFEQGDGLGGGQLLLEFDLGDGKPLQANFSIDAAGSPENEYMAAQRFIHSNFEFLNNNHLEEIARKIRNFTAPVLATIQNLKIAVQNSG